MSCLFKQKTAYEMRISDWSSDVCSSDLAGLAPRQQSKLRCLSRQRGTFRFRKDPRMGEPALEHRHSFDPFDLPRSEERRGGKECVSPCSSRWSPCHYT